MNPDEAYTIMEDVVKFLDEYADIEDGDYGEQLPNKAMRLKSYCEDILAWLEKMT